VTGRALLLATAEAPFFGSEVPYELELWSETGWHVHGFAELGVPVPYIGRNERLAWGAAPAARDSGTVQRLVFGHPTDSVAYRAGAGWERASSWLDTVHVNTPAGVEARTYRFLGTHDGPVISRRGDTAFVVHLPGGGVGGTLQRRLAMSRARSLAEFKAVLEARGRPGGAVAYADVDGNILVDRGDGSGTLLNPASGEVRASASGREWPAGDSALTAAGLARLALGVPPAVPSAEIEQLVHEWEQVGGRNSGRAFAMDTAIEMLRLWDRRGAGTAAASEAGRAGAVAGGAALDSAVAAGATLYHVWREAYRAGAATDGPPEADAGIHVADPAGSFVRFRSLEEAVARLRREWGTVRVPWTEMARLQRPVVSGEAQFRDDAPSTPVTGLPDGSPFVLSTVPGPTRRRYANAGTAAVMVTEFVTPPRTWSIAVFGQSADTGSSHYFDQAARYAAGELKDAQFGGGPVRERYQPGRRARVLHGETPIR
jgi:acyl-homoserine-lactone acylase